MIDLAVFDANEARWQEIGARLHLFRDPCEAIEMLADRSVEVAAKVFYAAIDEFGDPGIFFDDIAQSTF